MRGINKAAMQNFFTRYRDSALQIDPRLFTKYEISAVPSFVLACDEKYDKIAGNISIKFALQKISDLGDLSEEAKNIARSEILLLLLHAQRFLLQHQ
jgi:type-F conjugative transfer system pilin assembly protein TrbC